MSYNFILDQENKNFCYSFNISCVELSEQLYIHRNGIYIIVILILILSKVEVRRFYLRESLFTVH